MRDTRIAGSGYGRPVGLPPIPEARAGTRPADCGIPTVYTNCHGLTKDGQPCQAPPAQGGKWCVGHRRQKEKDAALGDS